MAAWLSLLIANLMLVGLVTAFGFSMALEPPDRNKLFGYRTPASQRSDAAWDFANRMWGRLTRVLGPAWAVVVLVAMLPVLGRSPDFIAYYGCGLLLLTTLAIAASVIPVERALKRDFDGDGRPRTLQANPARR
jgi:uncharacterized membrane protein